MKGYDLLTGLLDTLLAAALAFAGVACLLTGFSADASLQAAAMTALCCAAVTALLTRLRGGGWLLALAAVLGGLLLRQRGFADNFLTLAGKIFHMYNTGYGWALPELSDYYSDPDLTLAAQAMAGFFAALAALSLQKRQLTAAALAVILPLLPCTLLTDTVPAAPYLLLAIAALALLALTRHARRAEPRQLLRLTALLLAPLVLGMAVLSVAIPQEGYAPPAGSQGAFALIDRLAAYVPFLGRPGGPGQAPATGPHVSLSAVGLRPPDSTPALQVVSSQSGTLYLRGRSYDRYTGLTWTAGSGSEALKPPADTYLSGSTQTLQILPLDGQTVQYIPYYATEGLVLTDGALAYEGEEAYYYRYQSLRFNWKALWQRQNGGSADYAGLEDYLQLPEDTRDALQAHLQAAGIREGSSAFDIAAAIEKYVAALVPYSTATDAMPAEETDFALWFLEEGETGYCIHFATAATVLLRAAGIPARYVEGYLAITVAGQNTTVPADQAHAWAEYYVPQVGWVILEATPSAGLPVEPIDPTQPSQTTEPTAPTAPTEPTAPTPSTAPSQPPTTAAPTEPTAPSQTTRPTAPSETAPGTEPTAPTAPGGEAPKQSYDLGWLVKYLAGLLALAALVTVQWQVRLRLRRRRMAGRALRHVRTRWRCVCRLAVLCHHLPPKGLGALVKKAQFGRNGLSDRELRQFDRYIALCIRALQRQPWYVQLAIRLIFAIW